MAELTECNLLGAWDAREASWFEPEGRRKEREAWLAAHDILPKYNYVYRVEFYRALDDGPRAILYRYDSNAEGKRYLTVPDRFAARAIPIEIRLDELPSEFASA